MNTRIQTLAVLLVCSCTTPKPTAEPAKTGATPPPAFVSPLAEAMQAHWALTVWTRDAVVAGDLESAGKGARILASHEPSDAVPGWTPYVDEMKANASRVADASTIEDAASAVGDLGATCGNCHVETGAVLRFPDEQPPAASNDVSAHMARHAWASQAMWRGLVGPDNDAWLAGADVLRDRPLHDHEFFDQWTLTPELTRLGTRVHDVGVEAHDAPSSERARIYGELVATCASCHASLSPSANP